MNQELGDCGGGNDESVMRVKQEGKNAYEIVSNKIIEDLVNSKGPIRCYDFKMNQLIMFEQLCRS